MSYEAKATSVTPALIIYLLDVSDSMTRPMDGKRRIDVVRESLEIAVTRMVYLATVGMGVRERYRIGIYAYSDDVYDVVGGIHPLNEVAALLPKMQLQTFNLTDTALAFQAVEELLKEEIKKLPEDSPAPLVCHLTDGLYTGSDPEPTVRRIMQMPSVPDGPVLVENIFISDDVLAQPIASVYEWEGITANTALKSDYARKLRSISSPLPSTYWSIIREGGYCLDRNANMLLPGNRAELIELGFVMSQATRVGDR